MSNTFFQGCENFCRGLGPLSLRAWWARWDHSTGWSPVYL